MSFNHETKSDGGGSDYEAVNLITPSSTQRSSAEINGNLSTKGSSGLSAGDNDGGSDQEDNSVVFIPCVNLISPISVPRPTQVHAGVEDGFAESIIQQGQMVPGGQPGAGVDGGGRGRGAITNLLSIVHHHHHQHHLHQHHEHHHHHHHHDAAAAPAVPAAVPGAVPGADAASPPVPVAVGDVVPMNHKAGCNHMFGTVKRATRAWAKNPGHLYAWCGQCKTAQYL